MVQWCNGATTCLEIYRFYSTLRCTSMVLRSFEIWGSRASRRTLPQVLDWSNHVQLVLYHTDECTRCGLSKGMVIQSTDFCMHDSQNLWTLNRMADMSWMLGKTWNTPGTPGIILSQAARPINCSMPPTLHKGRHYVEIQLLRWETVAHV